MKRSSETVVSAAVHGDWNGQNIIRLLNAGESPDRGVLTLSAPVKKAYVVDLRGNRVEELPCENGRIPFVLGPKKLLSIALYR